MRVLTTLNLDTMVKSAGHMGLTNIPFGTSKCSELRGWTSPSCPSMRSNDDRAIFD